MLSTVISCYYLTLGLIQKMRNELVNGKARRIRKARWKKNNEDSDIKIDWIFPAFSVQYNLHRYILIWSAEYAQTHFTLACCGSTGRKRKPLTIFIAHLLEISLLFILSPWAILLAGNFSLGTTSIKIIIITIIFKANVPTGICESTLVRLRFFSFP